MQLINLASGISYFPTPEQARLAAAVALEADVAGKYGPLEGIPTLRTAIADRFKTEGVEIAAEQVLVTPGSKQALFNLFSVLLQEGDEVVVPTPAWFGFQELVNYSKGTLIPMPTLLENGYAIDTEVLRSTLTNRSRILLLTNPANPTGRVYTKAELEAILAVAADFPNLYVLSDEIYDFVTYSSLFTTIFSCQGATERTVVISGFSKSFAMSGWRVGYIAGAPDLIARCARFQASTAGGISPLLQHGAAAAMHARQLIVPPMLQAFQENKLFVKKVLDELQHVYYFMPQGAYYFFPDLSYYLNRKTPSGEEISSVTGLCYYLKNYFALELAPGDKFWTPGHVRMSFAVEKHVLEEAMQRLTEGLKTLEFQTGL